MKMILSRRPKGRSPLGLRWRTLHLSPLSPRPRARRGARRHHRRAYGWRRRFHAQQYLRRLL